MALDTENCSSAYLCGRLFAVLEKAQKDIAPNLNKTIKDTYFSSACTTPSVVFPRLIKLAQNHLAKMEERTNIYYSKLVGEVINQLKNEFPSTLTLEEQGKFIIGYYQQNQEFYKSKEEKNKENKEN
jgi:CRISPR-associated protein Csd1